MVDTGKIRSNLGGRAAIALNRNDALELIEVYELHLARNVIPSEVPGEPYDGYYVDASIADQLCEDVPVRNFPSEFEAKH